MNPSQISEKVLSLLRKEVPNAKGYELGALLISIGCWLIFIEVPTLKEELKPMMLLSRQLMEQEEIKALLEKKKEEGEKKDDE